jgi:hypothetical protein
MMKCKKYMGAMVSLIAFCGPAFLCSGCKKEFRNKGKEQIVHYETDYTRVIRDVLRSVDGNTYYVWGGTGSGNETGPVTIIKEGPDGNTVWEKKFDVTQYSFSEGGVSIHEKTDGTLLLVGSVHHSSGITGGFDTKLMKIGQDGTVLKETFFSAFNRDTAIAPWIYNSVYRNSFSADGAGGFFFQVYAFSENVLYENFVIHYSGLDSVDGQLSLNTASTFYFSLSPNSMCLTGETGALILSHYRLQDGKFYVEELDKTEFFKKKAVKIWRTVVSDTLVSIGSQVGEGQAYQYPIQIVRDPEGRYLLDGKKLDGHSGVVLKKWLIPLTFLNYNDEPSIASSVLVDHDTVYCAFSDAADIHVVKMTPDNGLVWHREVGGEVSRDKVHLVRIEGDNIVIGGISTSNRSQGGNSFICRMSKQGKLIVK